MLPPPQSISSKKKGKKRGRYPKKDYISEAKQKISMNNWQDVNSSFGEALCSLDDAQIAARAVDEDMMAMSVSEGALVMIVADQRHRIDSRTFTRVVIDYTA